MSRGMNITARPLPFSLLLFPALVAACGSAGSSATAPDSNTGSEAGVEAGRDAAAHDAASDSGVAVAFHFMDVSAGGGEITSTRETDGGAAAYEALIGDIVDVRLTGLSPASTVTIYARNFGADGTWYEANATFVAASDGTVDAASTAPSSGTYPGVDPDGLIWSGQPKPEPSDATADQATLYFRAEVHGATVATSALFRYAIAKGVTETNVSANGLVGVFYAPAISAKRGAIIAFGGSEGGLSTGQFLAAYYASLGYPALGLAYFHAPGLPDNLASVPLEYFQHAHDWLVAQSVVDPGKIAVNGGSRGGELALLLGATFPWVTAVVAEEGSGVLWGDDAYGDGTYNTASWTLMGKALPFVSYADIPPMTEMLPDGGTAVVLTPFYETSLNGASVSQLAAATIPVENTKGPVMMTSGADDQLDPSCQLSALSLQRLVGLGHADTYADQFTCYAGAGHNTFAPPGVPTLSDLSATFPLTSEVLELGGDAKEVAMAQRDVDTRLRAFLAANLR